MRREDLVTHERQLHSLGDVMEGYAQLGIRVEEEHKRVPAHRLISTQNAIEADKYELVYELVRDGKLDVPVLVEEHFVGNGGYERYLIDGHTRTRAHIELGHTTVDAFVIWSPAGDWPSNFARVAEHYGNVLVKDLPIEPRGGKSGTGRDE
ncbi:MAG: ParB/RepB/Spo0J family partition protein [Armatimonadota bacterium]